MKQKNIIFDFGNVLGIFDIEKLVQKCGYTCTESIRQAIFHDWDALDAGLVSYENYVQKALDLACEDEKEAVQCFFEKWYLLLENVEEVHEWIYELKKEDYHLYVLSNAPVIFEEHVFNYSIMKEFDGAVFSGSIKLSKPDIRIYDYLLEKYHLKADECFFIDDRKENIDGAISCGIKAMVYHHNLEDIKKAIQS